MKPTFHSCWVGTRLLPLANACLNSFTVAGFPFRLFTYNTVADVPESVDLVDATILAAKREVFLAHGGWETFADLLAYRFLFEIGGWWVDMDVLCNTAEAPSGAIAFAEERPGIINNAVLRFPKRHPVIGELLQHVAGIDAGQAPWGATGPRALTTVLRAHDLSGHERPTSEFYPIHWREAPKLLFPEFTDEMRARTGDAPFVHLWGATLREVGFPMDRARPPLGSFLDEVYSKYLDPGVLATLAPLPDAPFRDAVKNHVARHWNLTLAI